MYITTPIYYLNGSPHLGHAYTNIAADVIARNKRKKEPVFFLTGTDEHGQKVQSAAEAEGLTPQDFVDKVSKRFLDLNAALNISNDFFIRTTDPRHKKLCQDAWTQLYNSDHIYLSKYEGWYSKRDECFYSEDEVFDSTPNGKVSIDTGSPVEWVSEPAYFFTISTFKDQIKQHILKNKNFITPLFARNEVLALLDTTPDVCVSRTSFSWGVLVPNDPAHVMYVWIDALLNYISALHINEKEEFWPAIHIVGKEITRFHAIIWPALLLALNLELPERIVAHGWWTVDGKKMGKSIGNTIDPIDYVKKYGADCFRYFVLREVPFGNDGNFSDAAFIQRCNAELSNELGNLVQRTLSVINKKGFSKEDLILKTIPNPEVVNLITNARNLVISVDTALDDFNFTKALDAIWEVVRSANSYVSQNKPWEDTDDSVFHLSVLYDVINSVAIALEPFIPESAKKIQFQLENCPDRPYPVFPRIAS